MKLFRLRFVLLGLLLCVCHVWSLSCRTEFDDPASKAYQSEVVVVGKVEQILPPVNNLYNVTVKIKKKRDVYRGEKIIQQGKKRRVGRITVGQFGPEDINNCIASVKRDKQYIFFLNSTSDKEYLTNSRMPLSSEDKKGFKRAKKDIKKILCSDGKCVKAPTVDSKKALKDKSVAFGRTIDLNCRIKRTSKPQALFQWFKDGVEIKHRGFKGLSIKTGKKGSRLKKSKANLQDAGTYVCIVKNVGGEIKQQSVISISGVQRPEAPGRPMKDRKQKFGGTLKLTCKVKGDTTPKPTFRWFKDGKEIKDGSKPFLSIRTKGSESTLRKERAGLSDGGKYECVAENVKGNETQTSIVTITDAPQKIVPCDEKDKNYCLNNGNCSVMVELGKKFCTCPRYYQGSRCDTFVIPPDIRREIQDGEQKLAQDRTIVVVGIISGILLFIGICVASYFLAKRRRSRFLRRRNQNAHHIEDIPQVYRPLPACDDVDGPGKLFSRGVTIHKEIQTTETCFLQEDRKFTLYINPLEGYNPPSREERNSRSRLTAVSLEGANRASSPNNPERRESHGNKNNEKNNSPNRPNSKRVPSERDQPQPHGARERGNEPNSINPPAFNLDTDSEDEILNEETPLTPLHISEDEDTLRRRRERESNASNDNNVSKSSYRRDSSNDSNNSKPPSYTTALQGDNIDRLDKSNSMDGIYATSSPSSSESSSTTEGCDSPNSRYLNELSLSEPEMNIPSYWNERGSPEPTKDFKSVPKYDYNPPYASNDKRAASKPDHLGNFRRGEIGV